MGEETSELASRNGRASNDRTSYLSVFHVLILKPEHALSDSETMDGTKRYHTALLDRACLFANEP